MSTFYALLIGIDYYTPKPDNYDHLQGCVRDIDKMGDYLERSLGIPSEQITRLTSPLPDTNSTSDVRSKREEKPPTYENIVQAFKDVTETAQAEDLVYIHYSGHGGRVKTIFPDLKKGEGQYDEGLVPMDVGNDGRYLRDVEMTTLLKRMTDKGLIVTVIFDSCHSGGATRSDGAVRGSRSGGADTKDRPAESAVADRETLEQNWLSVTQGDSRDSWLPNQRDYVFLGACRPTELANESTFDEQGRNGALTYWMLQTLGAVPEGLTYQALYDSVKGQIQSQFANQIPMLLGEGDRLVFGSEIKPVTYSLTVIGVDANRVRIDGGLAQGISRGAQFSLYPAGNDVPDPQQRLAIVEIVELDAEAATAKILTVQEGGIEISPDQVTAGLRAVMESAPLALKHPIRLFVKGVGEGEDQLTPDLADKQSIALEKVRQAMQGNGWVVEAAENEEGHYQVAVGRDGMYEICAGTPITNLTPALSLDDDEAPKKVVERLVHLGKYRNAQALANPISRLKSSIEYELLNPDTKDPFDNQNNIVLKSGDFAYLKVKNVSSQPLNVSVLDFEPTWAISQIPIQGDRGAFYSLQPGEETQTRLRFSIPSGQNYKQTEETLKLFATRGNANFQWLILPSLDNEADADFAQTRSALQTGTRSAAGSSPLAQLLSAIGADKANPPPATRASYEPDPNEEWLTKSILLTIEQ